MPRLLSLVNEPIKEPLVKDPWYMDAPSTTDRGAVLHMEKACTWVGEFEGGHRRWRRTWIFVTAMFSWMRGGLEGLRCKFKNYFLKLLIIVRLGFVQLWNSTKFGGCLVFFLWTNSPNCIENIKKIIDYHTFDKHKRDVHWQFIKAIWLKFKAHTQKSIYLRSIFLNFLDIWENNT